MTMITAYRIGDEIVVSVHQDYCGKIARVEDAVGTIYRRRLLRGTEIWLGKPLDDEAGTGIQAHLKEGARSDVLRAG